MNEWDENKKKKKLSYPEAFVKISRWCAYQERSQYETRNKLYEFGLFPSEVEQLIAELITSGFLNEERFARSFARGKFRIKHWGRNKIKAELTKRKIGSNLIKLALYEEIDSEEYIKTAVALVKRYAKNNQKKQIDYSVKHKIIQALLLKGFELDIITEAIKISQQDFI
jgi:regulatory protein